MSDQPAKPTPAPAADPAPAASPNRAAFDEYAELRNRQKDHAGDSVMARIIRERLDVLTAQIAPATAALDPAPAEFHDAPADVPTPDDEAFEVYRRQQAALEAKGYAGFGLGGPPHQPSKAPVPPPPASAPPASSDKGSPGPSEVEAFDQVLMADLGYRRRGGRGLGGR